MRVRVTLSLGFASLCFVQSVLSSQLALRQQCWHENTFLSVNFLSSADKNAQLVEYLGTYISPSSSLPSPSLLRVQPQPEADSEYFPWTHPPICTDILQSINDKLCVYTNSSFANNRGISIFTTPKLSTSFANLPAFQDPTAHADININSDMWITAELPGRGIGMTASRPLTFKDRITAYTPLFLAFMESELSTMEREKFWSTAIQRLPMEMHNMYLNLAKVYRIESVKYQDVVKANAFQVEVDGANHLALFPETSRFNHDCAPSAQYVIDPEFLTHTVHATRPIEKGEEITIAYTSPLTPTPERQSLLKSGFHFTCTCARCTNASKTDATFASMQTMQAALNDWSSTSKGSPQLAEQLLQMYRDEGLEGFMDVPYGFAALAWNAVGRADKALEYAALAKEAVLLKDWKGASGSLNIWEELLEDCRTHWSWNLRPARWV
ncbi:SET domain-containing protein [Periconia macrospinosa]|uniref:SET domain-containing protein n=1 Tax=Periconia macrospinosa TaxID=97972 RepID=A0A2V1DCY5_9PLEO|nr:SET domain-containing protein [Periconia macrospinosa]